MARREKHVPDYGNAPIIARAGGRLAGRTARCSPYYGIALSADALALSLENERMVYASMYGKANGTFTDKDILSAKNGTRASAFFFALSIMGASEAVRAWKLLSKYNNLIAPVQDGLASMKNGRALLESLSPNELSRLSQFRSDDVIYSLMDTMKNGKIGGGITLDEYINIRQQGAKSVGVGIEVVGKGGRPTWRQSEIDVGSGLGNGWRPQVAYKNGVEVPPGTPGSVRPDWSNSSTAVVEVKNYNIANNSSGLVRNVSGQIIQRSTNLPAGMQQQIVIDIRGQTGSLQRQIAIRQSIVMRSNGLISPNAIVFKTR